MDLGTFFLVLLATLPKLGEFDEIILCEGEKVKEKNATVNSKWNAAELLTRHNPEISKLERE